MSPDDSPDLWTALALAEQLQASIRGASASHFRFKAPVIDRQIAGWYSDSARGLSKFAESVDMMRARIEAMIEQGIVPRDDPLPHVESLVTTWKVVLKAEAPVAGVRTMLKSSPKRQKAKTEGFLDVVARGGEEWIRIYSKKVSSLMAELREQDSMINSDWSDSEDDAEGADAAEGVKRSNDAGGSQAVCQSLVDSVDSLLALADVSDRPPGAGAPRITLHVTRISLEDEELDERIPRTFHVIRSKGVHVVFGDLAHVPLDSLPRPAQPAPLRPSRRICLDPTALMALCSDLLHHPLPISRQDAMKRFFRPSEALGDDPGGRRANGPGRAGERGSGGTSYKAVDGSEDMEWRGQSQNSRELVKNLLEEMEAPLVEEIRDALEKASSAGEAVEWWTSKEAVVYLTEALGSEVLVGEGLEQRRMRRMVGLEEGDFWEGSRYAGREGILRGLSVRTFDDVNPAPVGATSHVPTSFHRSLAQVAQSCLADYNANLVRPSRKTHDALPNFLKPQRIPVPKVAQLSLPFPIVSLLTLARGAQEGMTTLMFGNVVLRDLFGQSRWKKHGWCQGSYELERAAVEAGEKVAAAVWMLPYRSLGEGKRIKFASGDYSYPNR